MSAVVSCFDMQFVRALGGRARKNVANLCLSVTKASVSFQLLETASSAGISCEKTSEFKRTMKIISRALR
tara:strand:- start:668 stop:877 length:210 start_codon:yes stop_codon:yes gene_type:complete